MNKVIVSLLLIIQIGSVYAQKLDKKVLVIGNSIMFYNEMPSTLSKLLNESNASYQVTDCSKGGSSLTRSLYTKYISSKKGYDIRDIDDTLGVKSSIEDTLQKNWDWIILLEQSMFTLYNELYEFVAKKAATGYKEIIDKTNPESKVILFENYAEKTVTNETVSSITIPLYLDSLQLVKIPDSR